MAVAPRTPEDGAQRLEALHDLGILDTPPEERELTDEQLGDPASGERMKRVLVIDDDDIRLLVRIPKPFDPLDLPRQLDEMVAGRA